MEQKNITAGGIITGVILIICGVIILPVAIGALLSFPHFIFYGGLVLVVTSGVMIFSGIRSIEKSRKEETLAEAVIQKMNESGTSYGTQPSPSNEVLAHWLYTPEEWNKFLQWERSERKTEFIIQIVLVAVLGTILLSLTRSAPVYIGLPISLSIGTLVAYLRYRYVFSSMENTAGKPYEVKISRTAFLINGKFNPFYSETYTPANIRIIEEASPKILEVKYGWNTRRGRTHEELRIPIPEGKYEEAKILLNQIKS